MISRLEIDRASIVDNDVTRQVEFTAEIDGEDREFAVTYAVLKELSGDEPEDDALELFEKYSDELVDICFEAATQRPSATVVLVDEGDLQ